MIAVFLLKIYVKWHVKSRWGADVNAHKNRCFVNAHSGGGGRDGDGGGRDNVFL